MKKLLILLFLIDTAYGSTEINRACKKYKATNCNLVKAIAWIESNHRHLINENDNNSRSYGMMQVKCIAARDVGYRGQCKNLRIKNVALKYGIKFLEKKMLENVFLDDVIASYNSNRPVRCRTYKPGKCYPNEYINHEYVYKVKRRYNYERLKEVKRNVGIKI